MPEPNRNAAKRDAIRRAALDVFLRRGYTNASVDEIVTESGVSRQTVYNNFGGKEALFLAVVDDVLDRFLAAMTAVVDEVALGESDEPAGWRANKAKGGIVMDVDSGEVITAVHHIPAREAQWAPMPAWVRPELRAAYAAKIPSAVTPLCRSPARMPATASSSGTQATSRWASSCSGT